ncbi:MAG TPA: AAA family ATPase [Longimicrobium sp.]|jgi:predicted kinase|nr:AAA family ATPase [Longimicrobium sp.]
MAAAGGTWRPEAVVFCGVQAAGKSTFYRERFFETHVRINMDMLKTRTRERLLLEACLVGKQPFVVDNTNPLAADRARYVQPARAAGFVVTGYFFRATTREAIARNRQRTDKAAIPVPGLLGTYKRLEEPRWTEGYDALFTVTLTPANVFVVEEVPRESLAP